MSVPGLCQFDGMIRSEGQKSSIRTGGGPASKFIWNLKIGNKCEHTHIAPVLCRDIPKLEGRTR